MLILLWHAKVYDWLSEMEVAVVPMLTSLGRAAPSEHRWRRDRSKFDKENTALMWVSLPGLAPGNPRLSQQGPLKHLAAFSSYFSVKATVICPPGNSLNHLGAVNVLLRGSLELLIEKLLVISVLAATLATSSVCDGGETRGQQRD